MKQKTNTEETLMKFPCSFSIKAMGKMAADFEVLVVDIVRKHYPDISAGAVTTNPSRTGKYIAITVTIEAQSKQQLDRIYLALTANKHVLIVF